ncbi:hypothetical protein ACFB49_42720 [Sphingomonas sp. DBB INV C78]|uniref:hypothetical protein n=1 Tax=Sphingomonas sp. DBB INV C78 TaxID=3349434 RepID=UPI0036D2092F
MRHVGHTYRLGTHGRAVTSHPGVGGTTFIALLSCSRCPKSGERNLRQMMPPDQIDRKFTQAGWKLDPHICPDCQRRANQEKTMTKPSPAAMKAQAAMFRLLSDHFDVEKGAFALGWSDEKIAAETGLAKDVVTEFRRAGFGEIKEPTELQAIRADINALEQLAREHLQGVTAEIAGLRSRLAQISSRVGA